MEESKKVEWVDQDDYKYGFSTDTTSVYKSPKGLSKDVIQTISARKGEPAWMLEYRLAAYEVFLKKPMPSWGADLSAINFDDIHFYIQPQDRPQTSWDDVPAEIKETFDKIGVPEAEKRFLAGSGAQFESEVIYHSLHESLAKQGVIFESTDIALQKYPELFREYFGTIVPMTDNKFAALNAACWSGGSFIYIPKGVEVALPLQAYFRINAENMGQFERTLIIADEGAKVHYVEGCTAPTYTTDSLHSAVVEIVVKKGARVQYTTIQNWSKNVFNLVTKRAVAYRNAEMVWVDCNLGSKVTMKYPCVILKEEGARAEVQSLALASGAQHQDAGAKVIHLASNTSANIVSKSISKDGGRSSYRGMVRVAKGAKNTKVRVVCDALLVDAQSQSDTYPTMIVDEQTASVAHEASVARMSQDDLFYIKSRGFSEQDAASMVVNGFAGPIIKQLPMEYALELNRLIAMEMEGSIG